jgi:hypothetical protein
VTTLPVWRLAPVAERRAREAKRRQVAADALDSFLAGRSLETALHASSRVGRLADERMASCPDGTVVYLLVDLAGHVLYVGQSGGWRERAGQHHNGWIGQIVDHVRVIPASPDWDRRGLEEALIEILQPPYNSSGTTHGLCLPAVGDSLDRFYYGEADAGSVERCEALRLAWQDSHKPMFPRDAEAAA